MPNTEAAEDNAVSKSYMTCLFLYLIQPDTYSLQFKTGQNLIQNFLLCHVINIKKNNIYIQMLFCSTTHLCNAKQ